MYAISGQQTLTDMGDPSPRLSHHRRRHAVRSMCIKASSTTWLTGPQMMDGLALGETTPGPLIMIVTWVGYLGGVAKGVFSNPIAAGVAGAAAATFFTFLPSFLFILAGGPLVEATRDEIKFTAPLTGITAAVVGVILNLAVFFAWHTFWPQGTVAAPFAGTFNWFPVVIAIASFVALWKYKVDIMKVIGACALVGLAYAFIKPMIG